MSQQPPTTPLALVHELSLGLQSLFLRLADLEHENRELRAKLARLEAAPDTPGAR